MTEVIDTTATEDSGWSGDETAPAATYPETPANPHNHRFTVSYDPNKPPFIVVRANTAAELKEAFEELEESGALAAMGAAQSALKAQGMIGAGLGPTTVIPQGPQAPANAFNPQGHFNAPQGNTPPPFGPNVSVPGAPGFMGQQGGFAPQQNFAPQGPQLPPGWYKLNVPFPQKGAFDGIVAQYNIQKGDPTRGGQVSFQKANKSWYCSPEVAQAFAQFSPTPA